MLDGLDRLSSDHLNRERLQDIYRPLLTLHEASDLPATFAFVGAFTLSREVFDRFLSDRNVVGAGVERWLAFRSVQGGGQLFRR